MLSNNRKLKMNCYNTEGPKDASFTKNGGEVDTAWYSWTIIIQRKEKDKSTCSLSTHVEIKKKKRRNHSSLVRGSRVRSLTRGRSTRIEGRGRGRIEKDRWVGHDPDQWVLTTRAPGNHAPPQDCRRSSFRHLPFAYRWPAVELSAALCGISRPTSI